MQVRHLSLHTWPVVPVRSSFWAADLPMRALTASEPITPAAKEDRRKLARGASSEGKDSLFRKDSKQQLDRASLWNPSHALPTSTLKFYSQTLSRIFFAKTPAANLVEVGNTAATESRVGARDE